MSEDTPRLITIREACARTSISRTMMNKLRATGRFPKAVPLGEKRIAFVAKEIDLWIEERIASRPSEAA